MPNKPQEKCFHCKDRIAVKDGICDECRDIFIQEASKKNEPHSPSPSPTDMWEEKIDEWAEAILVSVSRMSPIKFTKDEMILKIAFLKGIIRDDRRLLVEEVGKIIEGMKVTRWEEHGRQCIKGTRRCGNVDRPHELADRCSTCSYHEKTLNDLLVRLASLHKQ